MELCRQLEWPGDFQTLAADRINKGLSAVQIVVGLYPDMPLFDPRRADEGGYPWEACYIRIEPHSFDMTDL